MKKVLLISILFLSGCASKQLRLAEEANRINYGGYLAAQSDCREDNKISINFTPEGSENQVDIVIPAQGCDRIQRPEHGGKHIADVQKSYIKGVSTIAGVLVQGAIGYAVSEDNNDTRVELSELQNDRQNSNNAVLVSAINSSETQSQAVLDFAETQSDALTSLIESLTEEPEEEEVVLDE